MLPQILSADVCSLVVDLPRLALSLFVEIDAEGRVRARRYERTRIRCRYALSYEDAQDVLEGRRSIAPDIDEAVRQLAAHAKVPVRDIGVPGMKDRHAVTTQTVSIPAPMSAAAADFDAHIRGFQGQGIRILNAARHNNKLRTGHLRGNRLI